MNRIELAQYFIDEYTNHKARVVCVLVPDEPLAVDIVLSDGISQRVSGKMAVDIKNAEDT